MIIGKVHEHNHPHVLMLQIANAFFKLPGDYLLPHEEEIPGFQTRLSERLSPQRTAPAAGVAGGTSNGTATSPSAGSGAIGTTPTSSTTLSPPPSTYPHHLIPQG